MPATVEVLLTGSPIPAYGHPGDAGADLSAAEAVVLAPGERATIGTGCAIALPDGFAAFVVPRSGLAAKHGITIVNSPGTVDAGYRGELRVTLLNTDAHEKLLDRGRRPHRATHHLARRSGTLRSRGVSSRFAPWSAWIRFHRLR